MPSQIRAVIDRRILINYRVDPEVARKLTPMPFRPQVIGGFAIAGICLIRLRRIRPRGAPSGVGLTTENAAHRFAVQCDSPSGQVTGVFIPRRDTNSRLTALAGGRLFPGWHHRARFDVEESDDRYSVKLTSHADGCRIQVAARLSDVVMQGSVFEDIGEASRFFRDASLGYSVRRHGACFDAVELTSQDWRLFPLTVEQAASSYFDDTGTFPPGSIELDSAFLMRTLDTTWSAHLPLQYTSTPLPAARTATADR
jgi:hypothetical protein